MNYYSVRIDGGLSISGEIIRAHQKYHLDSSFILLIAHEHINGENPHYHSIIYTDKIEAFRKHLKRKLNIGGNSDYSISKTIETDKYIAYIMKEANILYEIGITAEQKQLALDRVSKIETEKHISLVDKVFNHLENYKFDPLDDFSFQSAVLNYFKDNKLSYPSRNWMNSLRVKFWMETNSKIDTDLKSEQIARIYGFDNQITRNIKLENQQLKQQLHEYKLKEPKKKDYSEVVRKAFQEDLIINFD